MNPMDSYIKTIARFTQIDEKTLTPAELKKREEIATAIDREQPGMPMDKKMAIATATAKKVAESSEYDSVNSVLAILDSIAEESAKTGHYYTEARNPKHDPIGKEDGDVDNDGDEDDSDEYLKNRREVITKAKSKDDEMDEACSSKKMKKEEAELDEEQIDEISDRMKQNYIDAANKDVAKANRFANKARAHGNYAHAKAATDHKNKRLDGISKASRTMGEQTEEENMMNEQQGDPTGLKIYHKDANTGKEHHTIVFTANDAARHEKTLKKDGHKVTGRSLMFGTKEGERHPVKEDVDVSSMTQMLPESVSFGALKKTYIK